MNSSRWSGDGDGDEGRGVVGVDKGSMCLPGIGGFAGPNSTYFPGMGGGRGSSKRGAEVGGLGGSGGGRGAEPKGRWIGSLGGLTGTVLSYGDLVSEPDHLSWALLCGMEG